MQDSPRRSQRIVVEDLWEAIPDGVERAIDARKIVGGYSVEKYPDIAGGKPVRPVYPVCPPVVTPICPPIVVGLIANDPVRDLRA
jgi:hypothetical protein